MSWQGDQEHFLKWIQASEGVPKDAPLEDWFHAHARMDRHRALGIYANAYFARIHDVMKELFPELLEHMGEADFWNLVTIYLQQFPPHHYSLRQIGAKLPELLSHLDDPLPREIALVEQARIDVFDASMGEVLYPSSLSEEELVGVELPSRKGWQLLELEAYRGGGTVAVVRPEEEPMTVQVPLKVQFLVQLLHSKGSVTLSEAAEGLLEVHSPDEVPGTLQISLKWCLEHGLLAQIP